MRATTTALVALILVLFGCVDFEGEPTDDLDDEIVIAPQSSNDSRSQEEPFEAPEQAGDPPATGDDDSVGLIACACRTTNSNAMYDCEEYEGSSEAALDDCRDYCYGMGYSGVHMETGTDCFEMVSHWQ